jgi:serine/threonine-protein kinase
VTTDQKLYEAVARLTAPPQAEVHHLCDAGVGTFEVSHLDDDGRRNVYAVKVTSEPQGHHAPHPPRDFAALRHINHPHIGRFRDTGIAQHNGRDYRWLAMDFVDGTTLAHLLADGVEIYMPTAIRVLQDAVAGASALWRVGIAHLDIVPDNLVVTATGDTVLVDLGPAQNADHTLDRDGAGALRVDGVPAVEGWLVDQFDLGRVGLHLLADLEGFDHLDRSAAPMESVPAADPPRGSTPSTASNLMRILSKMVAPRPADRYEDWDVLLAELGAASKLHGDSKTRWAPSRRQASTCRRPTPETRSVADRD